MERTKHQGETEYTAGCTVTLQETVLVFVKGNRIKELSLTEEIFSPTFFLETVEQVGSNASKVSSCNTAGTFPIQPSLLSNG